LTQVAKPTLDRSVSLVSDLAQRYTQVRQATTELCAPLATEDYVVQSMPDASPVKWHLAHTTWFFEAFVLAEAHEGYRPFDPQFNYLFNSYYLAKGNRHARVERGLLSRPTVDEVHRYRAAVDERMLALVVPGNGRLTEELAARIELGLHHEQQHQELMLTDLKHLFSVNPLRPTYRQRAEVTEPSSTSVSGPIAAPLRFLRYGGGLVEIGHDGNGFAYDNESPRHQVWLAPYELASRLVTSGEYLEFIEDGGYRRGELWLSLGWDVVQQRAWEAPLYWEKHDGRWQQMTLAGMRDVVEAEPVAHLSYFEADAFARWAAARLPTEAEWEAAAASAPVEGPFVEGRAFHPQAAPADAVGLAQMFGQLWQWTGSAYLAYPGYQPAPGALGEYNGKFMCNQFVLRGGSCATPRSHIRRTYRNFFPPDARWQFTGIRLARDV